MPTYQLKVFGTGLLVTAKAISAKQSKFWIKKKNTDLLQYLSEGVETFRQFKVPKYAEFKGAFAEEERDLLINIPDPKISRDIKLIQIYGPKINQVDKIEIRIVNDPRFSPLIIKKPKINFDELFDEDDEQVCAFVEVSESNLLYFELEEGCWTYEFEANGFVDENSKISVITTNGSFNAVIDKIFDDVCVSFVVDGSFAKLVDADTQNLDSIAFVCNE
jgi:hypothetical protein